MAIIKWTPFLEEPFSEMDRFFDSFLPATKSGQSSLIPAIDVYEDKNNVIVETQLAGVDPEKVDMTIENDILVVKGKSEKKSEVDEKNYYRKEIRRGSFYRSIQLPCQVKEDKAEAEAIDGVLKITIPKAKEESKKKPIKIKTKKKK